MTTPQLVVEFKRKVFLKRTSQDLLLADKIFLEELNGSEILKSRYLEKHLTKTDSENIQRFQAEFLKSLQSEGIDVAILAIGSSTFPLTLMEQADYNYRDIDFLVVGKNPSDVIRLGESQDSRLVKCVNSYLLSLRDSKSFCTDQQRLSPLEVTNRDAIFLPYGRPNVEIITRDIKETKPIHLIVEYHYPKGKVGNLSEEDQLYLKEPTAERKIERVRKKNLPFSLLYN